MTRAPASLDSGTPTRSAILTPLAVALWGLVTAGTLSAQQESVAGTLHNLSASGPGEVRSLTESEICKFCHVPHSAVQPAALWGHALSKATYATPQVKRGRPDARPAPQPQGASRLCLSCHDGTVALGDVAGQPRRIQMAGGRERMQQGDRGFIGTDLTGSHPVSFVVEGGELDTQLSDSDMGLRPVPAIRAQSRVRLDNENRMQCTSCHDPHSDRNYQEGKVPHFWVGSTVDEVCNTCHIVR